MEDLSKEFKFVKFILPHAPSRSIIMRGGLRMNAWYDVKDISKRGEEELFHIDDTRNYIIELIKKEIDSGIDASRVIIGGFSQVLFSPVKQIGRNGFLLHSISTGFQYWRSYGS